MDAIRELVDLSRAAATPQLAAIANESLVEKVFALQADSDEVTAAWKFALDSDQERRWPDPVCRAVFLAALGACLELANETDRRALAAALGQISTRGGTRLSVAGTRCELFARAGEALYKEGRHIPTSGLGQRMLLVAEVLFTVMLADCRQKDDPRFWSKWRGMRGVCRLMLAVQDDVASVESKAAQWVGAATDLRLAFDAGNRGPSAAAYLIDAMVHQLEVSPTEGLFEQIEAVAASLRQDERESRSVLALLGQYKFVRSFQEEQPLAFLESAVAFLGLALERPQHLSHEDSFVLLLKGQALIRFSQCFATTDPPRSLDLLSQAIDDLKSAVESAPHKYLRQASLPSALISRADRYVELRLFAEAREDLLYLLQEGYRSGIDPSLRSQADSHLHTLDLRQSMDAGDADGMEAAIGAILDQQQEDGGNLVLCALAAKRLFAARDASNDPSLLKRTIHAMELNRPDESSPIAHRRMYAGLLATLHYTLGRAWEGDRLDTATNAFKSALSLYDEEPPLELRSVVADCTLHAAKWHLRNGNPEVAEAMFSDAASLLLALADSSLQPGARVGDSFDLTVAYSKAGEALLRLAALTYESEDVRAAIRCLTRARELGNATHQLLGLLGDAYYRAYQRDRQIEDLNSAIELKRLARDAGGASRENLSLSARLAFHKFQRLDDQAHLFECVELVARASGASPDWPWPPFQLYESLDGIDSLVLSQITGQISAEFAELPLMRALAEFGREGLARHGCRLVLANDEFALRRLAGGRQPVHILEDGHGLLSSSYVFKHTDAENAQRDMDVNRSFATFLLDRGIQGLHIPQPVTIVPNAGERAVVYVMRRARGYHLGRLAVRARKLAEQPPLGPYTRALGYLAAFHAWGETVRSSPMLPVRRFVLSRLSEVFGRSALRLPSASNQMLERLGSVPAFIKKDSHPENWLIDEWQNLAMIDFENSRAMPAVFEVVQLLEDYPLLGTGDEDWSSRLAMCRTYLERKESLAASPRRVEANHVDALYGVFAVVRCAFGFARLSGLAGMSRSSSSALLSRDLRKAHYLDTLAHLRERHVEIGVRALAETVHQGLV